MSVAALVVGGEGSEALRETVVAAGASRTWCAVPNDREAASVAGLAETVVLDPWPGATKAMDLLARVTEKERARMTAVLLKAGTIMRRGALERAEHAIGNRDTLIVPAHHGARLRLRTHRAARLEPGSGVVVSGTLLAWLVRRGWLNGTPPTLQSVRARGARLKALRRALAKPSTAPKGERPGITVLIPANNEAACLGDTLRAIAAQTVQPDEIIVVDDYSTDATGEIARAHGATVVRPPVNQGSKAMASNYGLPYVRTEALIVLDADTQLHPEALEHLSNDLRGGLDATSGACLPRIQQGIWARGRAIEYSMAIRIHKPVQTGLGTLVVMSGCISMFRTSVIRELGGFSGRTLAEDIDATWEYQTKGGKAGYNAKAMSFPVEPMTWKLYKAQMRRWASGFYQSVGVHNLRLRRKPGLSLIVLASLWDVFTVPLMVIGLLTALVLGRFEWHYWALVGAFLMLPLISGASVIGLRKTLRNFPAYLVTVWTNSYFYVEALFVEWILRRKRVAWVKGH